MTYDSDTWGGPQLLDGVSYQTFCGGGSSDGCTTRDIGLGINLNPREGYHRVVQLPASQFHGVPILASNHASAKCNRFGDLAW